ncbi:MAG: hypothetical protein A4E30_00092 [Methanomassiliicoccales archaeon PtaB.Bin215]|nr:MAG: hypothetical protein A4E30_00092 [Methanomassiliicoccales archaeon PtaB.Bin215]
MRQLRSRHLPAGHGLDEPRDHGQAGRAEVPALRRDHQGRLPVRQGAYPHGGRPHGHLGRLRRYGSIPGAQLVPACHHGSGYGQAVVGTGFQQLPQAPRHPRAHPALSAEADGPDQVHGLRGLQPAPGRPELRGRRAILPRLQHGRCADTQPEQRAARPRTVDLHEDVPHGGAPVPRRAGGPLRDTVPGRPRRPYRLGLQQPLRGGRADIA